jgi:hypothetical protein
MVQMNETRDYCFEEGWMLSNFLIIFSAGL